MTVMNDQCLNCKIRKWCYREEPEEDWTCDYYKSNDEYVDFLDEDRGDRLFEGVRYKCHA